MIKRQFHATQGDRNESPDGIIIEWDSLRTRRYRDSSKGREIILACEFGESIYKQPYLSFWMFPDKQTWSDGSPVTDDDLNQIMADLETIYEPRGVKVFISRKP